MGAYNEHSVLSKVLQLSCATLHNGSPSLRLVFVIKTKRQSYSEHWELEGVVPGEGPLVLSLAFFPQLALPPVPVNKLLFHPQDLCQRVSAQTGSRAMELGLAGSTRKARPWSLLRPCPGHRLA